MSANGLGDFNLQGLSRHTVADHLIVSQCRIGLGVANKSFPACYNWGFEDPITAMHLGHGARDHEAWLGICSFWYTPLGRLWLHLSPCVTSRCSRSLILIHMFLPAQWNSVHPTTVTLWRWWKEFILTRITAHKSVVYFQIDFALKRRRCLSEVQDDWSFVRISRDTCA